MLNCTGAGRVRQAGSSGERRLTEERRIKDGSGGVGEGGGAGDDGYGEEEMARREVGCRARGSEEPRARRGRGCCEALGRTWEGLCAGRAWLVRNIPNQLSYLLLLSSSFTEASYCLLHGYSCCLRNRSPYSIRSATTVSSSQHTSCSWLRALSVSCFRNTSSTLGFETSSTHRLKVRP
ncbi:uncharacterized protein A4U43_C01F17240 [Asparagus officinalis]|uniref:Uncharacterized protein n=1 Tax=Asparagus officinalis TaxID=4686 RepID=A0A5P1FQA2_ASPOF|nr:uncharacterized protein A4U43_C01F17240 [Asparagus officinalis]